MLRKYFPFLVIILVIWYLPELYLSVRNLSTSFFSDVRVKNAYSVEFKVVKPVGFLPEKYSVIGNGVPQLRVELNGIGVQFVRSNVTDEMGKTVLEDIPSGKYKVRVGKEVSFDQGVISQSESMGESILDSQDLLTTSISAVNISKDTYIVPIIR